ncbi:MAG: hypothetical protein QOF16_1631 [Actinomycetota bacterium]|jgi:hypothetical protein|nr:hypothetical protein [Actinomycetota bacterium]
MKSSVSVLSLARDRRAAAIVAVTTLALSIVVGAPAHGAAAWYASPTGAGSTCSQTAPCDLQTAINFAANGDDVYAIADQGDYSLSQGVSTISNTAIHLHSLNGRARLNFQSGGLKMSSGSVEDFYVQGFGTVLSLGSGAVGDRMFAEQAGNGHACFMQGATLTNSVCWAGTSGDLAMETDGSNTLRNVSLMAGTEAAILTYGRNGCSCTSATDTLVNVIARSSQSGVDLLVDSDASVDASISASYSNFETTQTRGSGSPSKTHITTDATDQTTAPLFVDAAAGDFHEASGSPTIDAGVTDSANGSMDLDGNPRVVNGVTDIGAYEAPLTDPVPDTTITKTTIKRTKHRAGFTFEAVGTASGFECALKKIKNGTVGTLTFSACTSPKTYRKLKVGRYIFEVRAFSSGGTDPTPATKRFKI